MDYPAEFAGTSEERAEQDGRLQGADAHLDVRPPDHPGRAVRRLPADHRPQAAGRGRLLRPRLRVAARAVRAGPLGARDRRPRRRRHQAGPHRGAHPLLPVARPPHGRHGPAGLPPAQAPRPGRADARPDAVGPRPHVPDGRLRRQAPRQAARGARPAARLVLPHGGQRVHAPAGPAAAHAGSRSASSPGTPARRARTSCASCAGSTRRRPSRPSCRPSTSARSGSRSRVASRSSPCSTRSCPRRRTAGSTRSASAWPTAAG